MEFTVNPHDRLFKDVWSHREAAQDFFRNYLPGELQEAIDLSTLQICKDSFVQNDLREFFSDLLYKVSISSHEGYIYLLFEHKSYSERLILVQLLSYMRSI